MYHQTSHHPEKQILLPVRWSLRRIYSIVQERKSTQTFRDDFIMEFRHEYFFIDHEMYFSTPVSRYLQQSWSVKLSTPFWTTIRRSTAVRTIETAGIFSITYELSGATHLKAHWIMNSDTPCSPPDTLYEFWLNLPPACMDMTISAAERLGSCLSSNYGRYWNSRPLSATEIELSAWMVITISSQCPASASSMALSTTSKPYDANRYHQKYRRYISTLELPTPSPNTWFIVSRWSLSSIILNPVSFHVKPLQIINLKHMIMRIGITTYLNRSLPE